MTDLAPVESTNLGHAEDTMLAWSRVRDVLTAPSPPDHPGGYFPSYLGTVRPDGRPHVTPLIGVWVDDAIHVTTGAHERKALNIAANPHCVVTTGTNALHGGLDVVVEGDAVRLTDDASLGRVAEAYVAKYGEEWRFTVEDGVFVHEAGEALVFRIAPETAFGFGKDPYSQTRWRFA